MTTPCHSLQYRLLDGADLNATERAHLAQCPACQEHAALLAALPRALPQVAPPPALDAAVRAAARQPQSRPALHWHDYRWLAAAAAALAIAIGLYLVLRPAAPVAPLIAEQPAPALVPSQPPPATGDDALLAWDAGALETQLLALEAELVVIDQLAEPGAVLATWP
jgi:hypothetical protein